MNGKSSAARRMAYSGLLLVLLFGGVSCNKQYLSVHTDYISHRTLASYYVNTPDPLLNDPPIGQRLILSWSIPKCTIPGNDLKLRIYIRFWNRQQIVKVEPITKQRGTVVYTLMNEDYISARGIMSYKAEIVDDDVIIAEWKHQIWTEVINIGADEEEELEEEEIETQDGC
jgi:hypothetical protein